MIIGLDTRTLETAHRFRGIGTYAHNLIKAISQMDWQNKYVFFTQKNPSKASGINFPGNFHHQDYLIRKTSDPSKYNWYLDQLYFPLAIRRSGVQIMHILDQLSAPLVKCAKTIVTVCDLQQIEKDYQSAWKNNIKISSIKRADKIIAISCATKNDLINNLGIAAEKITVIYCGYDKAIFKPVTNHKKNDLILSKLKSQGVDKYFLYLGSYVTFNSRKNINFLLKTFREFLKCRQEKITLVMVGKEGEESEKIKKLARSMGIGDRIAFTDFVDVKDLPYYLHNAAALLFPSLAEGFGLPALEAMACGCAVIAANRGALREVVGNAGLLLDPQDHSGWIKSMQNILDNRSLSKKLIGQGLLQAKNFSWEKCAQETIGLYKRVIGQ